MSSPIGAIIILNVSLPSELKLKLSENTRWFSSEVTSRTEFSIGLLDVSRTSSIEGKMLYIVSVKDSDIMLAGCIGNWFTELCNCTLI